MRVKYFIMDINSRFQEVIDTLYDGKQNAFAKAIGVAPSVIANVVGSRKGKPSFDVLYKICANANVSANWLLTGNGPMLLDDAGSASSGGGTDADKESLTIVGDVGNADATASGAHSVAAINSTVTKTVNAPSPPPDASLRRENELLHDLLAEKERVIDEKERLISVLMERK